MIMEKVDNIADKEVVNIESSKSTPAILLDRLNGTIKMEGRSLPENPKTYYESVKRWLSVYAENPENETNVTFDLDYFNTASGKVIMEIIDILKTIDERGKEIKIEWRYQEDDEDTLEAGEDFAELTGLEMNFISYP